MKVDFIVIHCSDTPDNREATAADIHRWHGDPKPKGNGWSGIGYHYVIQRSGKLEAGRPEYWSGAHVRNHNSHSLGICLIGRKEFTAEQYEVLEDQIRRLLDRHPDATVLGHRDLDKKKTCPNFDVKAWWERVSDGS